MAELASDHFPLEGAELPRRYFATFREVLSHMGRVAGMMEADGAFGRDELEIVARYLLGLGFTFRALSNKYHMAGRTGTPLPGELTIDRTESGFPIHAELLQMASDAAQAGRHLKNMPSAEALKDQMIREIVGELRHPVKLQYAMSQRLYYEELARGQLFWPQMDPDLKWRRNTGSGREVRRHYLVHWAVYDSGVNLPTIYLMEIEDSGRTALPKDERRWPEVQAHLMAQSMAGLKLMTIATGFDKDFDDLHPKRLRRLHVGPFYAQAFTTQTGPLRQVLDQAGHAAGMDWAMAWTVEELESERVQTEKSGWFGQVERQIFARDPFSAGGVDIGASRMERAIILPERPYQVLAELDPPGFREVQKYVVAPSGRVVRYR